MRRSLRSHRASLVLMEENISASTALKGKRMTVVIESVSDGGISVPDGDVPGPRGHAIQHWQLDRSGQGRLDSTTSCVNPYGNEILRSRRFGWVTASANGIFRSRPPCSNGLGGSFAREFRCWNTRTGNKISGLESDCRVPPGNGIRRRWPD